MSKNEGSNGYSITNKVLKPTDETNSQTSMGLGEWVSECVE